MSTIKSSEKSSSILYNRLPTDQPKPNNLMAVSNVTPTAGYNRRFQETIRTQPIYSPQPQTSNPLYAPIPQKSSIVSNPTYSPQIAQPYYIPQQGYQYAAQPYITNPYAPTYAPSISSAHSYPAFPVGAHNANSSQYVTSQPLTAARDMYSHIVGLK